MPGRWLSNRALNLLGTRLPAGAGARHRRHRPHPDAPPDPPPGAVRGAAKLWSLREEKQKWQTWMGIFFLFLAAMATSVHPSVVLYLVVFLGLTVVLMVRFVYLHVLTSFGHRDLEPPQLPVRAFLVGAVAATLVLAVPLFALLPRVRSPYIMAPGGGGGQLESRAGFSDAMSLDLIGRIRDNRQIAMRLTFTGNSAPPGAMRFKAATYDVWQGRTWRRSAASRTLRRNPREGTLPARRGYPLRVGADRPRAAALDQPDRPHGDAGGRSRPGGARPRPRRRALSQGDARGGPRLQGRSGRVGTVARRSAEGARRAPCWRAHHARVFRIRRSTCPASRRRSPHSPRSGRGAGTPRERARRIERHLLFDYAYTLEFIGRGGERPIEYFLLEARRGHCEYFASAMVLLLRAQGIPARLVTGFLGAEYAPWERAWVVRQSNAHAWVEGYLPGAGWQVFDPTPPAGRPTSEPESLLGSMREAWEFVLFRWDRYVISFDFYDQVGIFFRLRIPLGPVHEGALPTRRAGRARRAAGEPSAASPAAGAGAPKRAWRRRSGAIRGSGGSAAPCLSPSPGIVFLLRRREEWNATRAYLALRSTLAGAGLGLPPWLGPLALVDFAAAPPAGGGAGDRPPGRRLSPRELRRREAGGRALGRNCATTSPQSTGRPAPRSPRAGASSGASVARRAVQMWNTFRTPDTRREAR